MIGRKVQRKSEDDLSVVKPKGFDDFELRLGDTMRGERATMGKSLLDVQRELRIKASYIAAIENSDPSAFDTPGFIAGYVRSYARYLGMNPDEAFHNFCQESGFAVAHGMSAEASVVKKSGKEEGIKSVAAPRDPFTAPNTPFVPGADSFFSQIEPRAVGSTLVLLALIGGIGYGGWAVLKEVQQVQFAPVEQAPVVLADLDPLAEATRPALSESETDSTAINVPDADAFDRLYRPQALDVPVLVARDGPISTLDPRNVGMLNQPSLPEVVDLSENVDMIIASLEPQQARNVTENVPQVVEPVAPALQVVAVRPSWVRVRSADGTVIFEKTMQPGETWEAPLTEEPPTLRTGESGAIYFAMGEKFYGPVGEAGAVTSNLPLSIASLQETYLPADMQRDEGLIRYAEALGLAATPVSD
ncbi:helix-turn-helix domain-containing protein [Heliomarina baculiformis]|uniref:helix-turn-helix domain-containing protein n=1 Tax=Heliomarina baculiformis TaxID=2872036 RepID=UPI001EE1C9BA|nr:helix-turn-helix domain-containing protein [Heliomarina baculiformis]